MKILSLTQGSQDWLSARAQHFCASDAPAMMGASKYKSRSDLLREKATGITEEIDASKQALFDAGHATEALARKIIEEKLGPLTPIVATDDQDWLLASFDGLNEAHTVGWEHKLWNARLADFVSAKHLPPEYYWQLEHQILVGGLKGVVFTISDGTREKMVSMKYLPVPGRAEQLIAGWEQFESDLANYKPVEVLPPAVAAPVLALPAVSIQVSGTVALTSNLGLFLTELKGFISQIPEKPSTDDDFATCKAACKSLQDAQDALDAAEANALGQVASFDEMKRAKALCFDLARNTRLALEKLVVAREAQIKHEIVQKAKVLYAAHVEALKAETGGPWIMIAEPDFVGAVKNKRTVASLQNAVDTALANGKIAADASAKLIRANISCIKENGAGFEFLFNDRLALISKPIDDLRVIIKSRIADHKAAEAKREEETRERIRAEEQAKAQREAEAKIKAEQEAAQKAVAQASPSVAAAVHVAPVATAPAPAAQLADNPASSHAAAVVPAGTVQQGIHKLLQLIDKELAELTAGQLQEVLDHARQIRARKAAA